MSIKKERRHKLALMERKTKITPERFIEEHRNIQFNFSEKETTNMKVVKTKILDPRIGNEFPLPTYGTSGSAGLDLMAMVDELTIIQPGEVLKVKTGLSIYIEDPSYAGIILPRSGTGTKKGLILANTVGLIDSDYQGELIVALWNRGNEPQTITPGERIAQYVLIPVTQINMEIVDEFVPTERGIGGFGSTGTTTLQGTVNVKN